MVEKLEETWKGPVYYDVCGSCRAMWFDMGELDAMGTPVYQGIEAMARLGRAEGAAEPTRGCPRCDRWMDKVSFLDLGRIPPDYCPKCHGFWLDAGEIGEIRQELERVRLQKAREYDPALSFVEALLYCLRPW